MTAGQQAFLRLENVSKSYGGVRALTGVDFACSRGSIHAVLGENGAGKSTLIKIISGVVAPTEGRMWLDDREVRFASPSEANRAGIVCVFQELSLLPDLSIADNVCITSPPKRGFLIDARAQRRRAVELLAKVGCEDVHPKELVRDLPLSRRQMVEIAKALGRNPQLLILDEATSALTAADVEKVYQILLRLRDEGLSILYISHRMHEIQALADRISVFRNGRHIESFDKGARSENDIVELMIGRDYAHVFPPKPIRAARPQPALEISRLGWGDRLKSIDLEVGKGEVVGLGGLDGQGQRELLLALFGVLRGVTGTVKVAGKEVAIGSPQMAKTPEIAMALIPEDRKTEGLFLPMSVRDNLSMASISKLSRGLVVDRRAESDMIEQMIKKLQIKVADPALPVATLSGGNQQKVVIAKWLMTDAKIILLNDPTRGIDVGTKQEIYQLLRDLADAGTAILFYSTDYDELIGCCDRVAILYDGAVTRMLEGNTLNEHNIVASALNLPLTQTLPEERVG